ncbi:hypothetical protein IAQ61_004084 [Plenodomus lingam]|uniref:uncharacterized protein n=1 Tax=Leptosphaeria maculans TaxID=5022 RepID=UPI0033306246|nr:hypothetical protein IAQ61_004084 [Plenodomus lingam]
MYAIDGNIGEDPQEFISTNQSLSSTSKSDVLGRRNWSLLGTIPILDTLQPEYIDHSFVTVGPTSRLSGGASSIARQLYQL